MPVKDETISQPDLCRLLKKDDETLRLWRQEGCPHQVVKARPRYVVAKVVEWLQERSKRRAEPDSIAEAEKRKAIADAQLAELKLGRESGAMVSIDEATKETEKMLAALRAQLIALPSRWASKVIGLKTIAEVTVVLDQAIREAMVVLSGNDRG